MMAATSSLDTARKAASEINTARMDAQVLTTAIANRLEDFEYRECDKDTIDTLYAFTRLLGSSLEKIKDGHGAIEDLVFAKASPVCRGAA
ncbi:hypothetical protein [Massilia sp. CCM 8734]|uniref:hypothetical protein n=1 Tax=Massilia sp. CCM 8734 TaxID=2609283 RepID=UPI00141F81E2|nr:hypothetical protein [Massilia sp. CCM 8734]NHZ98076.1 hypothetical protein [Massilia sp. CCM 8734]